MRHCLRITAALLLALPLTSVRGQNAPADQSIPPFMNGYIALGNSFMNVDALNTRFSATGYDAIAGHGFSIGAGGYVPYGRALFGAEFHSADFGFESTDAGRTDKMSSHYWMGTVGYAFYTTWHFNVLGVLGAGVGTTTLTVSDRNGGTPVGNTTDPLFDDVLTSPGSSSVLTGTYTIFQPAFGVDYLMLRTDQSHVGVTFGLRLGTTISPHRTSWTYEGRDVVGAPDAGPVGAFLRLSVGIGGFKLVP